MNASQTPTKKDKQCTQSLPYIKISPVKVPNGAKQIGNYILGKTIGSGTYGKVHLGLHILTGERVAVKIIEKLKLSHNDLQRVYREISILQKIMHPSLIQLYEIIETDKSLLFITEYMQNGELFNYIIQKKKLSEEQACRIFHQIIDGIQYMHNIGVAHRDIKPENILMDFDGKVKIIDFGLSNNYKKNQKLKTQCGSPCYAAPEMIQGKHKYDPLQIDIWSAGIVLFAMIAGYLPFCDPDTVKLYKKILAGTFKFPTGISSEAKDLIQKILVTNHSKRATLDQIKSHPWYLQINTPSKVGIDTRYYRVPVQQRIVHNIERFGIKIPNLTESIEENVRNKETALYYILAKRMVKDGEKLQYFFQSDAFNPDHLKALDDHQPEESSTYIIDVQAASPVNLDEEFVKAPETTSSAHLYLESKDFESQLKEIMNSKSQTESTITHIKKDKFYANNLENKRKRQNLKITDSKSTMDTNTRQTKTVPKIQTRGEKISSIIRIYKLSNMTMSPKKSLRCSDNYCQKQKCLDSVNTAQSHHESSKRNNRFRKLVPLKNQKKTTDLIL